MTIKVAAEVVYTKPLSLFTICGTTAVVGANGVPYTDGSGTVKCL